MNATCHMCQLKYYNWFSDIILVDYTIVSLCRLHWLCGMPKVGLVVSCCRHSCILCDATSSYSRQRFSVAILRAFVDGSIPYEMTKESFVKQS